MSHIRTGNYLSKIARVTFLIYLFFTFFGTALPFRDRAASVDEVGTSNIVNQILFTSLFLVSSVCLYPKRKELARFIIKEKFLTMFLLWCLLSVVWSNYPFVSFKRIFQIFSSVTVILAFLFHVNETNDSLKYFKAILYLYIPLSILSCLVIPGAIDPVHSTWRGLTVGKNYLGQAGLVSIIVWMYTMKSNSLKSKFISGILLVLSAVLLVGSWSMTSILTFVLLTFLFVLFSIDKIFRSLCIGKTFSVLIIVSSILLFISIYYLGFDLIASSFNRMGKDTTFTGRTDLWIDILKIASDRLVMGYGYGGFWVIQYDNLDLMRLYEKYVWLPNEAHLGYLDIFVETGLLGLSLFVLMVIFYFKNLQKLKKPPFGLWLFVAALILNLQESTLFFSKILTGELFLFAYLALYAEVIKLNQVPGRQSPSLKSQR